jgi:hypothetical protein
VTATTPVDQPQSNLNITLSPSTSQTITTSVLKQGGTAVNFSTGWTFVMKSQLASNANPNIQANTVGSLTLTGGATGTVSMSFVEAAAQQQGLAAQNNYILLGSSDSGSTYVLLASGRLNVSQP